MDSSVSQLPIHISPEEQRSLEKSQRKFLALSANVKAARRAKKLVAHEQPMMVCELERTISLPVYKYPKSREYSTLARLFFRAGQKEKNPTPVTLILAVPLQVREEDNATLQRKIDDLNKDIKSMKLGEPWRPFPASNHRVETSRTPYVFWDFQDPYQSFLSYKRSCGLSPERLQDIECQMQTGKIRYVRALREKRA